MKHRHIFCLLPALLMAVPLTALADDDEDDHDQRRGHYQHQYQRQYQRDVKETYYDGHCKIERKFKKNGEYKEKRKCGAPAYEVYQPAPIYVPAPVYFSGNPGITINGTFQLGR